MVFPHHFSLSKFQTTPHFWQHLVDAAGRDTTATSSCTYASRSIRAVNLGMLFRLVVEPTHLKNMLVKLEPALVHQMFLVCFFVVGETRGFARVNHLKRPQKIEKKSQTINKGHLLRYLTIFRGPIFPCNFRCLWWTPGADGEIAASA